LEACFERELALRDKPLGYIYEDSAGNTAHIVDIDGTHVTLMSSERFNALNAMRKHEASEGYAIQDALNDGDAVTVDTAKPQPLEPYRDTWYERIIHAEVKHAAADGKTILQFPTGETAIMIEGLEQANIFRVVVNPASAIPITCPATARDIAVGCVLRQGNHGHDWIVTEVLGHGKFQAVLKERVTTEEMMLGPDQIAYNHRFDAETFDLPGTIDTSNSIYRFYEHRVQRCLKRFRPTMQRVTDQHGVTWFQLPLVPADATQPVSAFGVARPHPTDPSSSSS